MDRVNNGRIEYVEMQSSRSGLIAEIADSFNILKGQEFGFLVAILLMLIGCGLILRSGAYTNYMALKRKSEETQAKIDTGVSELIKFTTNNTALINETIKRLEKLERDMAQLKQYKGSEIENDLDEMRDEIKRIADFLQFNQVKRRF